MKHIPPKQKFLDRTLQRNIFLNIGNLNNTMHVQLFGVDIASDEFLSLKSKLELSLPTSHLLKVTRVQSMWLWAFFKRT